jgi:DNA-binding SARP family transcriptional activator
VGAELLATLGTSDPDGWRWAIIDSLPIAGREARTILLKALTRIANRETVKRLELVPGDDVAALRRQLRHIQSPRLFVRTLGGLELHRSSWEGPLVPIEKKRVRMLLAVLAGHHRAHLTRDQALEILWPDADPVSGVNSLNQTVYQLRRYIDPEYRGGESAEYVTSSADQVALTPDLVVTDLDEIRRLPERLSTTAWKGRESLVERAIGLVRGEFLADLRYEDWVSRQQLAVHSTVRTILMPVASRHDPSVGPEVAVRAALALLRLDPFDETATLALADALAASGRVAAARSVVVDYVKRLSEDLDLAPSAEFGAAALRHGQIEIDRTRRHIS